MQWKLALLETYKHCTAARCTLVLDSERGSLTWMHFSELSDVYTDRIGLFTLSKLYQGELQAEPAMFGFGARQRPLHLTSAVTVATTYLRQLIPSHRTSTHPPETGFYKLRPANKTDHLCPVFIRRHMFMKF